jgi:hypothetical protein
MMTTDSQAATEGTTTPAAEATPAAVAALTAPAPKWWEGDAFADPARNYLTAKGLTLDDPMQAMPKLIDIAANAEKRIGKGLDSIIEKPGKDQTYDQWIAANREALNLPAEPSAYQIAPPEGWPKDAPWDTVSEAKAREIGVKYGIPQAAMAELVGIQAAAAMEFMGQSDASLAQAKAQLMTDLQKDFGNQTPAVITKAKLGAQAVAQRAGLDMDALANLGDVLTDTLGDANAIRFMAAITDMMGDDGAVGMGKGGPMTMTPAEARQQLAALRAPKGDYYEASLKRDHAALATLKPKMDHLAKIAAQG